MATVLGRAWYGGVVGPAGFTPSLPLASGPAAAGSPCRGSPSPPGLTWDKHRVRGGESPGSPFWRKRRGFCVPTSYGVPREELPPPPLPPVLCPRSWVGGLLLGLQGHSLSAVRFVVTGMEQGLGAG